MGCKYLTDVLEKYMAVPEINRCTRGRKKCGKTRREERAGGAMATVISNKNTSEHIRVFIS